MTTIEWTQNSDGTQGRTWNPVVGCTKVSEGCRNCYAEKASRRQAAIADAMIEKGQVPTAKMNSYTRVVKYKDGYPLSQWSNKVVCLDDALDIPLKVRKPTTWFVNSMSDLFHPDVPFDFIDKVKAFIWLTPWHTYQTLTKRPEIQTIYDGKDRSSRIMRAMYQIVQDIPNNHPSVKQYNHLQKYGLPEFAPNEWKGTSVENQETADERIPHLIKCPAAFRFLSCEPLLGPIDLRFNHEILTDIMDADRNRHHNNIGKYPFPNCPSESRTRRSHVIGWTICGGESGPGARPFNIDWARSLRDQCGDAGVPFYMKQLGAKPVSTFDEWNDGIRTAGVRIGDDLMQWKLESRKGNNPDEWPADLRVREMPEVK